MGTDKSEKPAVSIHEKAKRYIRAKHAIQILSPILVIGIIIYLLNYFMIPPNWGSLTIIFGAFYFFFLVFPGLVILSLVFGRVWCGWVCCVGAIFDLTSGTKFDFEGLVLRKSWCKNICPIGAFNSLFNKISLLKLIKDEEKCVPTMCTSKKACAKECPMEADVLDQGLQDLRCIRCYKCVKVCEPDAIRIGWRWSKSEKRPKE